MLFWTRAYAGLGREVARLGGFREGSVEAQVWPDGETYQRVATPVAGEDAVLIAGTTGEADTLEAFDLACALVEQGARSLALAIPYFGYATMERAWARGDAVTAKSRARLWSALPVPPSGIRIHILEPHTPGLAYYFGDGLSASPVGADRLILGILEGFDADSPVLCSPDTGRIKWVDELAGAGGKPAAFVLKRRGADGKVVSLGLAGDVRGRKVILCDDMARSGGTLLNAARTCLEMGADSVDAVVVHGAFAPGALDTLRESGLIQSMHCSDSHPSAFGREPGWLTVHSCAPLLVLALKP